VSAAARAGAAVEATHVLVEGSVELGVSGFGVGVAVALSDVLVVGVEPSARGFGAGATAFGGARLTFDRLAIAAVHGVGLAAVPDDTSTSHTTDAQADGAELFLRGVRSSTIRFDGRSRTLVPTGRLVAYGLPVGDGCALDLRQTIVAEGGFGFFAAAGGTLAVRAGPNTGAARRDRRGQRPRGGPGRCRARGGEPVRQRDQRRAA
jgi:hypothetical protein